MKLITIEICRNRQEAEARKEIVKAGAPKANWQSRIVDHVDGITPFLVPDLAADPTPLDPVYSPGVQAPPAPASMLVIWTED